jgi:azurin
MFRRSALHSLFFLAILSSHAAETAVFTIKTRTAQMKYDLAELQVAPGQPVKITFENTDDLPHNLVFCNPGTDTVTMSMKQMERAEEALKRNWLPDDPRIWAHTGMLNPHQKEEISFTAPAKAGVYPYVCTFPGHAMTMRGEMRVAPQGEGLKDLKFKLYLGSWKNLPDFSKLTPHRVGDIPDNLIQVKLDDYKNEFGVVFTGRLTAPKKGSYRFFLASDDGGRILVDGKEVVVHDGIHPASIKEKAVQLEKGDHDFQLEYFQATGNVELFAAWKGGDFAITPLSKWLHPDWQSGGKKRKDQETTGMPLAVTNEPVVYRNFIQGAGNRGIAVGYPGGVSIAWSAESMNLALIWRGAFIDAARHWNSRGGGHQPPLGFDVLHPTGEVTPAFHITENPASEWPLWQKDTRYDGFEWNGYSLDAKRNPTFRYTWQGASMEETFAVEGNGMVQGGNARLIRTVKVSGDLPANAWYRLATAGRIEDKGGVFHCTDLGTRFRITAEGATIAGKNLVIPAKAATMTITYQWAQ